MLCPARRMGDLRANPLSATRWSKGSESFRVDREVNTNLVTQLT
jgi:hypothetical protein